MTCSTKPTIGGLSIFVVVAATVVTILGVIVMTSSIPESDCGDEKHTDIGIDSTDKDRIDEVVLYVGMPLFLGGIVGILGGGAGLFGGFKANKCAICSEAVLSGISAGLMAISCLLAMSMSAAFSTICDEYTCGAHDSGCTFSSTSDTCSLPNVCCKCEAGLTTMAACQKSIEWICEMKTKKTVAMLFALVGLILTLIVSACGCGAACCCPASFTELSDGEKAAQTAQPVGAVVGQPVGAYGENPIQKGEPVEAVNQA